MIAVLGAGAFGTALAISLAKAGRTVVLCARSHAQVMEMRNTKMNAARLPGIGFPDVLQIETAVPRKSAII